MNFCVSIWNVGYLRDVRLLRVYSEKMDERDFGIGYKFHFYKRSNDEKSFRAVKINHKNFVK